MQRSLLKKFFEGIDSEFFGTGTGRRSIDRICAWEETRQTVIECEVDAIHTLKFMRVYYGNFNVAYIPNSLEIVVIAVCGQEYSIDTRKFPRRAKNIDFHLNKIFGSINLQTLPEQLEFLDLSENSITGSISISRLPQTIKAIWLYRNWISQSPLFYNILPDCLVTIDINKNSIDCVQSLDGVPNPRAKMIFRGIPDQSIC